DALNQLEGMVQRPPQQEVMEPVQAFEEEPAEPMAPEEAMYLVFFDWDQSTLGAGALSVLDAVAEEVAKNPPGTINVVGHADTSGPKQYNQRLAFRRATAVRDALVERGVSAEM